MSKTKTGYCAKFGDEVAEKCLCDYHEPKQTAAKLKKPPRCKNCVFFQMKNKSIQTTEPTPQV